MCKFLFVLIVIEMLSGDTNLYITCHWLENICIPAYVTELIILIQDLLRIHSGIRARITITSILLFRGLRQCIWLAKCCLKNEPIDSVDEVSFFHAHAW